MSLADYEVFFRERLSVWNGALDVSPGSPIDTMVVQPLLRRLGTDPFTVDAATFIITRLSQELPEIAIGNGDGIEDLLMKPVLLLWDPIIREIQRIKNARGFNDPETLALEEAEALGSSFFIRRDTGEVSKGPCRIYYAQPQKETITAANFATSKRGLHYFPTGQQSITSQEMSLNKEGDLFYFDVTMTAESPGDEYNIEPGELTTIANVNAAVRITNKVRFRDGRPAENAATYVGRIERSLSEKSLVSLRGIAAVLGESLPEISRLGVVGFNDPEMQRDVITGGGLGASLITGVDGVIVADGKFENRSVRLHSDSADFTSLGPAGPSTGYILTVVGARGPGASPPIQDFPIVRVVSANEVDIDSSVLFLGAADVPFMVRKQELTLSGIPGGILQPNGPNGTLVVENNKIHIGGMTDMYVRGLSLETGSLILDAVVDEDPELSGIDCAVANPGVDSRVRLGDLILGTNYQVDDQAYQLLDEAKDRQYSLQILEGPIAGTYRILGVNQAAASPPLLELDPTPLPVTSPPSFRWRLVTQIVLDLVEPKDVRIRGTDGLGIQNQNVFQTSTPVDFDALGVSVNDILRISVGEVTGDYVIKEVIAPGFTSVRVDRVFTNSLTGATYQIFRANAEGGVERPLIRIKEVSLLDTSGQPVGTTIPYAKPVDVRSSAFSNVGIGSKVALSNASFGLVTKPFANAGANVSAGNLRLDGDGISPDLIVTLSGVLTPQQIADAFNAAAVAHAMIGYPIAFVRPASASTSRVCIAAFAPNTRTLPTSTVGTHNYLFSGTFEEHHSRDIRDLNSPAVVWTDVSPLIDTRLDVVWAQDGLNKGFHGIESVTPPTPVGFSTDSKALRSPVDFSPDFGNALVLGSRSFGTARLYFLEPTSISIGADTWFASTVAGGDVRYVPDTTISYQLIPSLPNGDKPLDGEVTGQVLTSVSSDFVRQGVRIGDELVIDFQPITGGTDLADPVPALALKSLVLSLSNQAERTITFVNDVGTPSAVSRSGVASQINSSVGQEICSVEEVTPGSFRLKFNPTIPLHILPTGSANTTIGFAALDYRNTALNAGTYEILDVSPTEITVDNLVGDITEQQFSINRPQTQRITSTTMANQVAEAGLYYWDVELFSEGPGDLWNLPTGTAMTAEGYASDGYYLSTNDSNTSMSPYESLFMHLSGSILPVGVDDSPENSIRLSGQSMSVSYEYSSLVSTLQSFITSDTERVVNENPLGRHLIPHFVRFDLNYSGGSREVEVQPDVETYIKNVLPDVPLESSDVQNIVRGRGADSIQNPIDLLAVVCNVDRSITVARSQDALSTGRLAAFIPDRIKLTRRNR